MALAISIIGLNGVLNFIAIRRRRPRTFAIDFEAKTLLYNGSSSRLVGAF